MEHADFIVAISQMGIASIGILSIKGKREKK
jgi:hypothetical protein